MPQSYDYARARLQGATIIRGVELLLGERR